MAHDKRKKLLIGTAGVVGLLIVALLALPSFIHVDAHKPEIVAVHKEAENIKLQNQKKEASPIPWHPGAVKYFAEKGVKLN